MASRLVPAVLIGFGSLCGAGGVALGVKATVDITSAKDRIEDAQALLDTERDKLERDAKMTNHSLQSLGRAQEQAIRVVVLRMADFLRRHKKLVSENERHLVDGLEAVSGKVAIDDGVDLDPLVLVEGLLGSAVAGGGVSVGLDKLVQAVGQAGTGKPIKELYGAAARNAKFAAFGGGPKAAGGGGKALGGAAVKAAVIGPAVLVAGLVAAAQGEKAKTQARLNEAEVNIAVASMGETKAAFDAIVVRVRELHGLLSELVARSTAALDLLESEAFDADRHGDRFRRAVSLTVAVRDLAATPVVDSHGELNEKTGAFTIKYRALLKEEERD